MKRILVGHGLATMHVYIALGPVILCMDLPYARLVSAS